MKDCFYQYRKGLYKVLTSIKYKGENLSVMEFANPEQTAPYLIILNMSSSFELDDDKDSQTVTADIMVVTENLGDPSDFGSKQSDDIMTLVMQKLITKGTTPSERAAFITMTDFTDAGCYLLALNYQPDFDGTKTTIRKTLTIQTLIDEN